MPKYLTDYNPKEKWDYHKSSSDVVSFYYAQSKDFNKYSSKIDSCAEWLRFNFFEMPNSESKLKLTGASFCRIRYCPVCQWRRSMAWRARMFNKFPELMEKHSNLSFIFLTLTVKNCAITELSKTLTEMNQAWNRLVGYKAFKKAVKGFIRATEVTKSNNDAHPHFHCILAVNKSYFTSKDYIKTEKWVELWGKTLKVDYLPIVDVRRIKYKNGQIDTKAVLETLKYSTKIGDLLEDKEWFLELTRQTHKKRFLSTGGVFKDILAEEISNQDMINTETIEEQIIQEAQALYFNWNVNVKKYQKKQRG